MYPEIEVKEKIMAQNAKNEKSEPGFYLLTYVKSQEEAKERTKVMLKQEKAETVQRRRIRLLSGFA